MFYRVGAVAIISVLLVHGSFGLGRSVEGAPTTQPKKEKRVKTLAFRDLDFGLSPTEVVGRCAKNGFVRDKELERENPNVRVFTGRVFGEKGMIRCNFIDDKLEDVGIYFIFDKPKGNGSAAMAHAKRTIGALDKQFGQGKDVERYTKDGFEPNNEVGAWEADAFVWIHSWSGVADDDSTAWTSVSGGDGSAGFVISFSSRKWLDISAENRRKSQ